MPSNKRKILRYPAFLCSGLLLFDAHPVLAAGTPEAFSLDNPLTTGLIILMLILLLMIGILANLLLGAAQVKMQREKKKAASAKHIIAALLLCTISSHSLFAGGNQADPALAGTAVREIAGVAGTAVYLMAAVVFLELLVIIVLLFNVNSLVKIDEEALEEKPAPVNAGNRTSNWWRRRNNLFLFKNDVTSDPGNRLPPAWHYGFVIAIIAAGIYLYRNQAAEAVSADARKNEAGISKTDLAAKHELEKKDDGPNENTVTLLTAPEDIEAGKAIFVKSCVACHNEGGAGNIGPNLTDDYWLHGGDVKSIFKTIRYGVNAMPPWQNSFSNKQIAEITSYVKSLKGTKPGNPKPPQGILYKDAGDSGKSTAALSLKPHSIAKNH